MDAPACEYCKIIFIASDSVFATFCGRLFHEVCVDRSYIGNWQRPVGLLRIYLPFEEEASATESLAIQYKTIKHELKEIHDEFERDKKKQSYYKAIIAKGKEISNQINLKSAELKKLIKEKETLQKKIKELEKLNAVQKALTGTISDVESFVNKKQPAYTLATMAAVLQRETKRAIAEKTELRSKMREDRKENEVLFETLRSRHDKFQIAVARCIKNGSEN